jgi:hypothetical protein
MDKQEAKLLLQSYRPDGQDASDPAFAEALALASQDAELGRWLEGECALDKIIGQHLREFPVPPDLRGAVVTGQRSQHRISQPAHAWWRSPSLAWAAAIVLVFVAAYFVRDGSDSSVALAAYRESMTANLRSGFVFDQRDERPEKLKDWLAEHGGMPDFQVPAGLRQAASLGCKLIEFNGMKSALICFSLSDQQVVHLFVVDGTRFRPQDFEAAACALRCNDYDTFAWREQDRVFLLAGGVGLDRLRELAGISPELSGN